MLRRLGCSCEGEEELGFEEEVFADVLVQIGPGLKQRGCHVPIETETVSVGIRVICSVFMPDCIELSAEVGDSGMEV